MAVDMRSASFLNEIASWAKSAGHGAIAVTAARAAAQLSEAEAADGGTPSAGAEIAAKVAWWADRAQPMLQAVARVESGGNGKHGKACACPTCSLTLHALPLQPTIHSDTLVRPTWRLCAAPYRQPRVLHNAPKAPCALLG